MPDSSGFADAPVTRALLFYLVAASLVVALADVKDLVDLKVSGGFAGGGGGGGGGGYGYDKDGGIAEGYGYEAGEAENSWGWWILVRVWRVAVWQVGQFLFCVI